MSASYRQQFAWLLLITAVVLAAGIGLRDPWPADEPRFALIARDMVATGDWLIPRVGGVAYPDKPPLFFWLVAAAYVVTGSLRIAFLLPGLLAGLGIVLLVTDLARRLWDPRTAIWCGAALMAMFQFPLQMKSGQIDAVLCFWTMLGLYGFCRHLLAGPDWRWYAIGGFACGLGVMTKGVGVLPYFVFLPYAFARRRGWLVFGTGRPDRRWLLAPAATLAALSLWLVPMLLATGDDAALLAYRDNILFHQTVTRYADAWGHIKPPWYLWTHAVPWLWLPVTAVLPWLIPAWWRDLRARQPAILLLLGWVVLVLVFFSLSDGKRSLYILPAAPALAMAAGYHARELVLQSNAARALVAFVVVFSAILLAAGGFLLTDPPQFARWTSDSLPVVETGLSLLAIGLFGSAVVLLYRRRHIVRALVGALAAFWIGLAVLVAPPLDAIRSGRSLIQRVEQQVADADGLGLVAWPEQFLLQATRPVVHFGYRRGDPEAEVRDALRWLVAAPNRQLLLPQHWLPDCLMPAAVVDIGSAHRKDWVLAGRDAVAAACRDSLQQPPELVYAYAGPGIEAPARMRTAASRDRVGAD